MNILKNTKVGTSIWKYFRDIKNKGERQEKQAGLNPNDF